MICSGQLFVDWGKPIRVRRIKEDMIYWTDNQYSLINYPKSSWCIKAYAIYEI